MKTGKLTLATGLFIIVQLLTGCTDDIFIKGNGIVTSEPRYASPFTEVNSSGSFDVYITPGETWAITVQAESNLLPYIDTDISHGILDVTVRGVRHLSNTRPVEIYVTTPVLKAIRLSGSGDITSGFFAGESFTALISGSGQITTAFRAEEADLTISGSGNMEVNGNMDKGRLTISGSGKIMGYNMKVKECIATISGSGDVYIFPLNKLHANIMGSGYVFYAGDPQVTSYITGSGKVLRGF